MTKLQLIYGNDQHNTVDALRDCALQPEGIDLIPVRYPAFYSVLNGDGFDVAEMSFLPFLMAVSSGWRGTMMEHCAGYLYEQGLMASRVEIEEYIPGTLLDT